MFDNSDISKLRFYSYATVAANKLLSSDLIEAVPHEQNPLNDGELTDHIEQVKGKGVDKDDANFDVSVDSTASIKAKWLSFTNTNRLTSPDVRRGEEVVIWQFGDTDQYWWTTLHQDRKIRRLETVIYGFSNNSKENIENSHDSMYWLEISTHKKVVRFHTSKNDGEPFTYDIQIDTKKGNITIEDDDGNYIFLDSKERHIKLRNKDNSFLELDKKIINMSSVEEINLKTKRYTLKATESIKEETKDRTCFSSKSIKEKTREYESISYSYIHQTRSFISDALITKTTGNFHVDGDQTTDGVSDNHHSHSF